MIAHKISITVGLTYWLWQFAEARMIRRLARESGVTVELTRNVSWLRLSCSWLVTGDPKYVDQFLGRFGRL